MSWYDIVNIDEIDSPSLVLYEDRLMYNLHTMLDMVGGDASKLMPHIKTNKMPEVIKRMIGQGIVQFKASTIAEAEMAAMAGAKGVLIAHQLVGPKMERLLSLIKHYPSTIFSTIIDDSGSLNRLNSLADQRNLIVNVYIDINNGMNRSGIEIGSKLDELIIEINGFNNIYFRGLHVYDGHHRDPEFNIRKEKIEEEFKTVTALFGKLLKLDSTLKLVCGGSPSFTAHLMEGDRICSPGTCLFWDWGYGDRFKEQKFNSAVLLISRVISKPTKGLITLDLGHKAVASENPIDRRVRFLNLHDYKLISQSEEHGVIEVKEWDGIKVGDVFYGLPYHICPTVNLYDEISVIENEMKTTTWQITGRKRRIRI